MMKGSYIGALILVIYAVTACTSEPDLKIEGEINGNIFLTINKTLEISCEDTNKNNNYLPNWKYPERLENDHRKKIYINADGGKSRLVIENAKAEDAGEYECWSNYQHKGKIRPKSKKIKVIVNNINKVDMEKTARSIKLLCDVQAYPSPTIFWKIDYDNKELNKNDYQHEEDYFDPETLVVISKSEGRFTLRQYNGVNNAELLITNSTKDDDGTYYCYSQNLAGEVKEALNFKHKKESKTVPTENFTPTANSEEPTNIVAKETRQYDDDMKDKFNVTSNVSWICWMDIACFVGICTALLLLGFIIYLIIRGQRMSKEEKPQQFLTNNSYNNDRPQNCIKIDEYSKLPTMELDTVEHQ